MKRYGMGFFQGAPAMFEQPDGDYVKWSEVAAILIPLAACNACDPNAKKTWAPQSRGRWMRVNVPGELWKEVKALTHGGPANLVTHCPWCAAPVSVADEPYCANADCRWNNGGTAPNRVTEASDWHTKAAAWLRAKADEQEATNKKHPRHAEAYPSWGERVKWWRVAADELSTDGVTACGNTPYDEGPFTIDQERTAFEAAMRVKHPEWAFTADPVFDYHNERTRCAWEGWQAARTSGVSLVDGESFSHQTPIPSPMDNEGEG